MLAKLLRRITPHNVSGFKVVEENIVEQNIAGSILEIYAIGKETKKGRMIRLKI
jgi:hypothetical protein